MNSVLFDNSMDVLTAAIDKALGPGSASKGVIVRDATGLLSFASADPAPIERRILQATASIKKSVGAYARNDRTLIFADDPGAQRILNDPDSFFINVGEVTYTLLDRRIVGSGWLASPIPKVSYPPRVVFASLKGGVGRSTALAVAASDLASRGRNVLVIDLDLEAPGLGQLMLPIDRTPQLGVLDYLVENGIGGISTHNLSKFVGTSPLTASAGGRVDVVPAFGRRSAELPYNILPKLARAMIDDVSSDGEVQSVSTQISEMIERLSNRESYDAVLIDSRAGLAELAAPAVLSLGALVLLFGTAQHQTIAGFKALFSGLKLLAQRSINRGEDSDWRLMFKPVYAKASLNPLISARHAADLYDLFSENLYDEMSSGDDAESLVNFAVGDLEAPHAPLVIPFDPRFVDFDPLLNRDHLAKEFYEQSYRPFMNGLDRAIEDLNHTIEPSLS